jgi:FkbH-like protein
LKCFDGLSLSEEDLSRKTLYAAEQRRKIDQKQFESIEEWLARLGLVVRFQKLDAANRSRAAQLFNKTNQMNLSTRRLSENELDDWSSDPERCLWTVTVSDRFGDYGLTGIVSLDMGRSSARLVDFILSCRVMGRQVEEAMLAFAVGEAKHQGCSQIEAIFVPTNKNKPCKEFFDRSGWHQDPVESVKYVWPLNEEYPFPNHVTITDDRSAVSIKGDESGA